MILVVTEGSHRCRTTTRKQRVNTERLILILYTPYTLPYFEFVFQELRRLDRLRDGRDNKDSGQGLVGLQKMGARKL